MAKKKKKQYERVAVQWIDSHDQGAATWLDPKDLKPGMLCTSVGLLVAETDEWLTVSHTHAEDGDVRGAFHIPKVCVLSTERF